MYKLETTPLPVSGILKEAWQLYKYTAMHLFFASLILAIIHVIPYLFGFIGFYHQDAGGKLIFSLWGVLLFLFFLLIEAYFVAILVYTMYQYATEQKINRLQIYRHSAYSVLYLYLGLLIYYFAINIGFLLFVLPAIFIAILFSMFIPYIIIEKCSLFKAFEGSVKLVWGHWWQTFTVLALPYSLIYLARNIINFTPWRADWSLLVDLVVLTFTAPYFYAALLLQFNNLKIIKSLPEPITNRPRTDLT